MSAIICKCEYEIPDGSKFCPNCGRKTPKPKHEVKPIDLNTRLSFSVKEAAQALSISQTTVRNLIHQGELEYVRIGKRLIIPKDNLQQFVTQNTTRVSLGSNAAPN
jgi:excisionase family DNA binding protein